MVKGSCVCCRSMLERGTSNQRRKYKQILFVSKTICYFFFNYFPMNEEKKRRKRRNERQRDTQRKKKEDTDVVEGMIVGRKERKLH